MFRVGSLRTSGDDRVTDVKSIVHLIDASKLTLRRNELTVACWIEYATSVFCNATEKRTVFRIAMQCKDFIISYCSMPQVDNISSWTLLMERRLLESTKKNNVSNLGGNCSLGQHLYRSVSGCDEDKYISLTESTRYGNTTFERHPTFLFIERS